MRFVFKFGKAKFKAPLRAGIPAFQASDTTSGEVLPLFRSQFHRTYLRADPAVSTAVRVKREAECGYTVEESVDQSQGTSCPAEEPESKNGTGQENNQDTELDEVHGADHGADLAAEDSERDSSLQCSGRTDIAAIGRFPEQIRDEKYQPDQSSPAEIAERAEELELGRGDLMEQILEEAERTDPATDQTPEASAEEKEKTSDIDGEMISSVTNEILE